MTYETSLRSMRTSAARLPIVSLLTALLLAALLLSPVGVAAQGAPSNEAEILELERRERELERELLDLKMRRADLRLQDAMRERDEARRQRDTVQGRVADLQRQKNAADVEIADLRTQLARAKSEADGVSAVALAEADARANSLQTKLNHLDTERRRLRSAVELLRLEAEMVADFRDLFDLPASLDMPLPGRSTEERRQRLADWPTQRARQQELRAMFAANAAANDGSMIALPTESSLFETADLVAPLVLAETAAERRAARDAMGAWVEERPGLAGIRTWLGLAELHTGNAMAAAERFAESAKLLDEQLGADHRATVQVRGFLTDALERIDTNAPDYPLAYERSLELLLGNVWLDMTMDLAREKAGTGAEGTAEANELAQLVNQMLGEEGAMESLPPGVRARVFAFQAASLAQRHPNETELTGRLLTEARAAAEEAYGEDDARTTNLELAMAVVARREGRTRDAETLALKAVERRRGTFGADHPFTASAMNAHGLALLDAGEFDAAAQTLGDAFTIFETSYGAGNPRTAAVAFNLGVARQLSAAGGDDAERLREAQRLSAMALADMTRRLGPGHDTIAEARQTRDTARERVAAAEEAARTRRAEIVASSTNAEPRGWKPDSDAPRDVASSTADTPTPPANYTPPPNPGQLFAPSPTTPAAPPSAAPQAASPNPPAPKAETPPAENADASEQSEETTERWDARFDAAWALYSDGTFARAAREFQSLARELERTIERDDTPPATTAQAWRMRRASLYNIACCNALAGRFNTAWSWLERAIDAGYDSTDHMRTDPDLALLRDMDAERFETLMKRAESTD